MLQIWQAHPQLKNKDSLEKNSHTSKNRHMVNTWVKIKSRVLEAIQMLVRRKKSSLAIKNCSSWILRGLFYLLITCSRGVGSIKISLQNIKQGRKIPLSEVNAFKLMLMQLIQCIALSSSVMKTREKIIFEKTYFLTERQPN